MYANTKVAGKPHVYSVFTIYTLQEIGEEFVEFLEKELNITDPEVEPNNINEGPEKGNPSRNSGTERTGSASKRESTTGASIEENIDEIEATLAQLKKELGL